jgi:ubiquinone/menaquinone biosynthesis C-methylase UbiE
MNAQGTFDVDAVKAATRRQWDESAAGWNAHAPAIRAWLATATEAMLDLAGVRPGSRVLDLAAGTGDQTIDIGRRVGAEGFVLATDLSPACLVLTGENVRQAGLSQVRTQVADAECLPTDSASFDAVVCRLGLMLLPDPRRALREAHRVLRPGGAICSLVFSRPERNPCIALLLSAALEHAGLPPRDPSQPGGLMSLGEPGKLDRLYRDAGFREVATTALPAPFRLPSARHYIDFVKASASPVRQILGGMGPSAAEAAWADIEARLTRFGGVDGWVGPNELLLTTGRR